MNHDLEVDHMCSCGEGYSASLAVRSPALEALRRSVSEIIATVPDLKVRCDFQVDGNRSDACTTWTTPQASEVPFSRLYKAEIHKNCFGGTLVGNVEFSDPKPKTLNPKP